MGLGNNAAGPNGDHGALGTGFLYGLFPIATTPGSWPTPVIAFAGGKFDSAAITCRGWMYTCGDNQFGQLGNGNLGVDSLAALNIITQFPPNTSILALPRRGPPTRTQRSTAPDMSGCGAKTPWAKVAAGRDHSLARTEFEWAQSSGANLKGQLGVGTVGAGAAIPAQVLTGPFNNPEINVRGVGR